MKTDVQTHFTNANYRNEKFLSPVQDAFSVREPDTAATDHTVLS
jgi:hypothetical protein